MARYIAKNIVAAGIAKECELQISYAIGVAEPVSVMVNTYGTNKVSEDKIAKVIQECFDLTPWGIIDYLQLRKPIFKATAVYGHFGREEETFLWERTDKAELLKDKLGKKS
jgi:S-adenosylmethionine synthetase